MNKHQAHIWLAANYFDFNRFAELDFPSNNFVLNQCSDAFQSHWKSSVIFTDNSEIVR